MPGPEHVARVELFDLVVLCCFLVHFYFFIFLLFSFLKTMTIVEKWEKTEQCHFLISQSHFIYIAKANSKDVLSKVNQIKSNTNKIKLKQSDIGKLQ